MRIGITGGIGCGKSFASSIFEHLGAAVYYSDIRARDLMTESPVLRNDIVRAFGAQAYLSGGQLNKEYLRTIVFADADGRALMNSIVHPVVGQDFVQWADAQKAPVVLFESALLLQTQSKELMHRIVAVWAPDEVRIARIMQRDGIDREAARQRISVQMPQEQICSRADDRIDNSGTVLIVPQIVTLFNTYKNGKI